MQRAISHRWFLVTAMDCYANIVSCRKASIQNSGKLSETNNSHTVFFLLLHWTVKEFLLSLTEGLLILIRSDCSWKYCLPFVIFSSSLWYLLLLQEWKISSADIFIWEGCFCTWLMCFMSSTKLSWALHKGRVRMRQLTETSAEGPAL